MSRKFLNLITHYIFSDTFSWNVDYCDCRFM